MADSESRSLRLAACVLLALSAFRWTAASDGPPLATDRTDGGERHARETRRAALDGERRSLPLEPGERLDPNRAPEAELDRLPGIGPATAKAIVDARASGLVVRRAMDLEAVKGVGPVLVERIAPYLDVTAPPNPPAAARSRVVSGRLVDINRADELRLAELPGIGPVIARRIVSARNERPFTSLSDLTRVQGIGDVTVTRLAGSVIVGRGRR